MHLIPSYQPATSTTDPVIPFPTPLPLPPLASPLHHPITLSCPRNRKESCCPSFAPKLLLPHLQRSPPPTRCPGPVQDRLRISRARATHGQARPLMALARPVKQHLQSREETLQTPTPTTSSHMSAPRLVASSSLREESAKRIRFSLFMQTWPHHGILEDM